jgi:hypothetical protein
MRMTVKRKKANVLVFLILAVVALVALPAGVRADDVDLLGTGDGLDCFVEKCGWGADASDCQTLNPKLALPYKSIDASGQEQTVHDLAAFFPQCATCGAPSDPVDAYAPDLFVILNPLSTGSLLPSTENWLQFIGNVPYFNNQNKPLKVHKINRPYDPSKYIIEDGSQKALRVIETDLTLAQSSRVLGYTLPHTTPATADDILIHAKAIEQYVDEKCPTGVTCIAKDPQTSTQVCPSSADPNGPACIKKLMKKYVIAHESGHAQMLTKYVNTSANGYHYTMGTGWLMDQSAYTSTKGTTVTWKIPTQHAIGTKSTTGDIPIFK